MLDSRSAASSPWLACHGTRPLTLGCWTREDLKVACPVVVKEIRHPSQLRETHQSLLIPDQDTFYRTQNTSPLQTSSTPPAECLPRLQASTHLSPSPRQGEPQLQKAAPSERHPPSPKTATQTSSTASKSACNSGPGPAPTAGPRPPPPSTTSTQYVRKQQHASRSAPPPTRPPRSARRLAGAAARSSPSSARAGARPSRTSAGTATSGSLAASASRIPREASLSGGSLRGALQIL